MDSDQARILPDKTLGVIWTLYPYSRKIFLENNNNLFWKKYQQTSKPLQITF